MFRIKGLSSADARRLHDCDFHSVDFRLIERGGMRSVNGVGGFSEEQVMGVLGQHYLTRLQEADILAVRVSRDTAKQYGYDQDMVLVDVDRLHQRSKGLRIVQEQPAAQSPRQG